MYIFFQNYYNLLYMFKFFLGFFILFPVIFYFIMGDLLISALI